MSLKNFVCVSLATGCGLGLSPVFPGSCGALAGVLIHFLVWSFVPATEWVPVLLAVFLSICILNDFLTPWAEKYWQAQDPKQFILDEITGYLLIPILFTSGAFIKVALFGYFFFRLFDIFKLIPPARYIDDHLHGSIGILLDDLVSSGWVILIMYLIILIKPGFFY